jgi:hypothetical protein
MRTSLLLILLALTGCPSTSTMGAGGARGGEIPQMPPGANLPRWEHVCVLLNNGETPNDWLVRAGDEGWELVTVQLGEYCFKRPKVVPASATP